MSSLFCRYVLLGTIAALAQTFRHNFLISVLPACSALLASNQAVNMRVCATQDTTVYEGHRTILLHRFVDEIVLS